MCCNRKGFFEIFVLCYWRECTDDEEQEYEVQERKQRVLLTFSGTSERHQVVKIFSDNAFSDIQALKMTEHQRLCKMIDSLQPKVIEVLKSKKDYFDSQTTDLRLVLAIGHMSRIYLWDVFSCYIVVWTINLRRFARLTESVTGVIIIEYSNLFPTA